MKMTYKKNIFQDENELQISTFSQPVLQQL